MTLNKSKAIWQSKEQKQAYFMFNASRQDKTVVASCFFTLFKSEYDAYCYWWKNIKKVQFWRFVKFLIFKREMKIKSKIFSKK